MKTPFRRGVVGGSTWSKWSLSAALAAALTITFSVVAQADSSDAKVTQTQLNSYLTMPQMAQTFTALHTGNLYQVDLYAGDNYYIIPTTIEVWNVAAGVPSNVYRFADGTPAATPVTNLLGVTLAWRQFKLASPVPVVAGTQYAVVTHTNLNFYFRWGYTNFSNANFAGGKMYVRFYSNTYWSQVQTGTSAFDFITYVNTAASQPKPPVVAADHAMSSAPEGTVPTMTGTFSDPNGGTVTLAADHGKVTPTTGTGGAWNWSGESWDEGGQPSPVTITGTNSAGLSTSTTFQVSVAGVNPVATISTDPTSIPEGSSLNLLGSATSPDAADQAAGFAFAWDVTKDGSPYSAGSGSSFKFGAGDEGLYVITLKATDDGGMTSPPASMTVVGAEVTPVAKINSVTPADPTLTIVAPQELLNFSGSFTDPAQESHSFRWDFGDGTSSTTLSSSHAYTAAGTYTVTLTVADDENVTGLATTKVAVETPQQALSSMIAFVQGLSSLNKGQQNSLIVKLQHASDSYGSGDHKTAHNQLNAFINELDADLKSGKISASAYNSLRADAHAIQGALGTYNRFVEWWPLAA